MAVVLKPGQPPRLRHPADRRLGAEQMVDLGGKQVRAVPISDRIGLEGQPTIHYMSPEGKYLGSVNKSARITILPTDAATASGDDDAAGGRSCCHGS